MSEGTSNSCDALLKFLKDRVKSNPGISFSKLTGNLAQLPRDLRTKYGSINSLKLFVQQFPEVFIIRNENNVYVRAESTQPTSAVTGSVDSFIRSTSDRSKDRDNVTCLTDVIGTVNRVFNFFGFISVEDPITTTVYFDLQSFENAKHRSLLSSGLQVGDSVILDAKVGPKDCYAEFRASRVFRPSPIKHSSSPCLPLHSATDRERGDRDTLAQLVNQRGVIERLKRNYGFIKFGSSNIERAFFHANNVDKSLGQSIENLPDVLTVGDKVRFDAIASERQSDKVQWEVTSLHLCRSTGSMDISGLDGELGKDIFMSDDESEIQDLLPVKIDECEYRVKGKRHERPLPECERRQELTGERGFFYPLTEKLGKVQFGPNRGSTAFAGVEVTYLDKKRIDNLLCEMANGQEVSFDAVQAEDNTWFATLVWVGQRPAKPLVGDSGDASRITDRSSGAWKPVRNAKPRPRGDFGRKETLQNVSPGFQSIHPSISTYKDAKGTIVQIMERIGICEVQELAVSRKIKFTNEIFYKNGTMIMNDLNEVLREGDKVSLDYMVGVSGTKEETRCALVWQGRRPKEVRQMSPDEFRQILQIDRQAGENSLCFQDFDREIEQAEETSRGPPRVPSNTGLQADTLPSRGIGASSSVPVSGLLSAPPTATNSRTHMRHPGDHNGSSTRESSSDLLFLLECLNDEETRRLARMMAVEVFAENRRRRVTLRDVGVQTVDEEP